MEPLVPALPSTNEYEDTATDNGRKGLHTQTHTHIHVFSQELSGKSHGASHVYKGAHGHAQPSDRKR